MRQWLAFSVCCLVLSAAIVMDTAPVRAQSLTAEGEKPGYRVEVVSLKREDGGTVTLTFRLHNDTDRRADFACELRENGSESCRQVSGVHLIDGVNRKKHLVVRDSTGACVCTTTLSNVEPKSSVNLWAKFPAPPENAQKVTVIVPQFLPVDNVPISR